MSRFANKAGFWGYRFLLATELLLVALLVMGGCYSKQNYRIMDAQSSDERLSKCNVVVEEVNKCRPLTSEEAMVFSQMSDAFPDNVQVRIGFNSQHGNSFSNLIVVPLGPASTTKPTVTINPSAPAAR